MITAIATGDKNVDKSLQNICAVIVRLSDAINNINTAISTLNGNLDKKFELIKNGIDEINSEISAMADSFETKTLLIGDVTAGNYVEIKETGEIELHGTNTIQINSGILYLKNGSTTERIRADSGNFYIENQTSPGVWDELLSGF